MPAEKSKRLRKTLTGHYHELLAVYTRTAAHKLPGAKGSIREDAVADFIRAWVQKRFSVPTNAFVTNRLGQEYPGELDLVIHDGNSGGLWNLDAQGGNCVVTWEEVRLIAQIKSTLDESTFSKACDSLLPLADYAKNSQTEKPLTVLFAYQVSDDFFHSLIEKFTYSTSDAFPFDAFILLNSGAYFSDSLRDLRIGIEKGLSPSQVNNDGPSQNILLLEDFVSYEIPNGYRGVSDCSPESGLLALAALATLATAGNDVTGALLAACTHSEHFPLFD